MLHGGDGYLGRHMVQVYEPEALLTYWMNLSILALTTAMLFYHVTRLYSIKANKNLAAFIAIALLEACHHDHRCPDEHVERIATTKKLNVGMSVITIGIELVIGYLIFNTIGKY